MRVTDSVRAVVTWANIIALVALLCGGLHLYVTSQIQNGIAQYHQRVIVPMTRPAGGK